MKVETKHKSCGTFGELPSGACFLFGGAIWMKTIGLNCAVRLTDGLIDTAFRSTDVTIPVEATVTWTWKPLE